MKIMMVVLMYFELMMVNCPMILYETDTRNRLQFDCLYYRANTEELAYQELSNLITDVIPYCFRPLNNSEELFRHVATSNDQYLTFEELHMNNISSRELLFWSSPIDLVEKYEIYLNTKDQSLANELFCNCTKPWFGLHCQYSFEFIEEMSINDVIYNQFTRKISYTNIFIPIPCYVHLKCNRGESLLCLDWREICDGHIDCLDEGLDEYFCFQMEVNECQDNEYRCHNGLCIPEQFWENGIGHADCLDRSDEYADVFYPNNCFQDPTFRCEEHSCRTNWHQFPCGDGQCVQKFDQCHNGRHIALIESIAIEGNLSNQCFIVMMCLTKLIQSDSCEMLIRNRMELLQYCNTIFQFPSIPIHSGHIRFLYENISLKTNLTSLLIIPDYICYNQQLCDCIIPDFIYENLTCIDSSKLDLTASVTGNIWIDMILSVNSYFRSCFMSMQLFNDRIKYENYSSLYRCENSSKFISKHRLMDENIDCCMGDDEKQDDEYSCSINNKHRIKCSGENKCLSSLHTQDDCPLNEKNFEKKIFFQNICDGLGEFLFKDSKTSQIYTDESDCHYWPCNNIYTRCDGYWTCPHGEDEQHCSTTSCPQEKFSCISSVNHSLVCLSSEQVNDGISDCLGSIDELGFCRRVYPSEINSQRFRCQNSDICLSLSELCNTIQSCPQGDDELFCGNHPITCDQNSSINRSMIAEIFCRLNELEQNKITHFSSYTSADYPQLKTNRTIQWKIEHQFMTKYNHSQKNSYLSPWYCNRGLIVQVKSPNNIRCMCPPSYYGDLCEYQNERVSLTLGLVRSERSDVYIIIIMLINNNPSREIDSHEQMEYIPSQSCGIKYNLYLLYSQRPKNMFKNYSIHIDVYEKQTMTYRGSWYLPIPFLFLPVNRLSALLVISSEQLASSSYCSTKCQHGQCMKYVNREDYSFCRCLPGWSGDQCHILINCQNCSSDSICIGSVNNRSICLCPLMKFGPRCLLTSSCPASACENNGQCIPSDMTSTSDKHYSCICSDHYYGSRCEYLKARLDIYLHHLDIPPFLLAFFFTLSNQSEPTSTIMIQKLTLFQRMVTFRISIPYHLVIVKSNTKYYLAVIQSLPSVDITTKINPSRECIPVQFLFNSTIMQMSPFQRIKYYHILCQMNSDLNCFLDEFYFCLCTIDHHANCFQFDFNQTHLQCSAKYICLNGGNCLQDHPTCPSTIICVCTDCFYGSQCQFYTKGLGLTLDEILTYEIKQNVSLSKQSFAIKLSILITTIILLAGILSSIFSILIFQTKTTQEVGCGMYLLISSILSLCIVILLTLKFWFLVCSYQEFSGQKSVRFLNCMIIEPLLKLCLNVNNWLNACVAGERAFAVFRGVSFQKKKSKQMAKWIIICLMVINLLLLIPQIFNLNLFYDVKEARSWCVIFYSEFLNNYNSFILFFHFFSPFLINFCSALFIIIGTARQRVLSQNTQQFTNHFLNKLNQHKHLLISPVILLILSLPRLIISFTLTCKKSSDQFWLYLSAYFISFMPSILILIVFVLPSPIYKKEFKQLLSRIQRRYALSNN